MSLRLHSPLRSGWLAVVFAIALAGVERIIASVAARLRRTPQWAKVIVEAALQQQG